MSHMNYQSSYNERTAMAERRARALRNRHQLEDTSGRLQEKRVGPVLVSPLNEEPSTAKIASQRFEPAYLKPTESLVGSDYAGGSSQSSSWEEAEAEWASVSPDNNLNAGNAVEKKNTLPVATKSRSLNHTHIVDSEDYPVTDGEDSLLESEDESSYMGGRRPTKTRINHKHRQIRQFKKSTVNNPNVLVRDINALNLQPRPAADFQQQRAPISSINSQLPNASPYSAAVSPQDDNSINSNSIGQTPAPILRKTESYRTLESFRTLDTSVSGGASETDDDDSMPKSRRKVKFHETSRGELRNTVHEYEDDSLTAYTEKTEDTISTSNDGNFPSIMDANMEDALLDFFFLGQSAHPRPAKKKKVPPKSKNRGNKKNNSRCNDDDDESFDEDFGTSKTKNNGTSTKKSRSRRDAENEVEVSDDGDSIESLKNKYPTKSKKKGSTKKIVSYSDSKNKDEISVEDDATLESETVMSAYTNETGSSWSKGSVEDETTAASSVVSNKYPMKKRRNPPEKQNKEETGDDPFQMVDNFCQMVGNACGMIALSMPPINVDVRKKESSSQDDRSVVSTKSNDSLVVASRASNNKCSPFFDIDTDALSTAQSKVIVLAYQCQDWVEQTAGLKVAQTPPSEVVDPPTSPVEEFLEAKENKIEEEVDDEKALENGLLELVKCAARSRHLQQGFVFDESYDIDVTSEVKFVAISTSLPLGVVFKENSGGCFVTRVFKSKSNADGSFAKIPIEVGDQLTSINGKSAMKKTVTQVCAMMNSSPDPKNISLTFLRYTGDIHSNTPPLLQEKKVVTSLPVNDSENSSLQNFRRSSSPEQIRDLPLPEAGTSEVLFIKTNSTLLRETRKVTLESNDPQQEYSKESQASTKPIDQAKENTKSNNARQPLRALDRNDKENGVTPSKRADQEKKTKGFFSRFRRHKKLV